MKIPSLFTRRGGSEPPAAVARASPTSGALGARPGFGERLGLRRKPVPKAGDLQAGAPEPQHGGDVPPARLAPGAALDRLRHLAQKPPQGQATASDASRRADAGGDAPGWPLLAPAVARRLDEVRSQEQARFDAARIAERKQELAAWSQPADTARELPLSQKPLAAYLTARAVDGRRVEGEDLKRLIKGQAAVVATRKAMSAGRGNVKVDIQATDHESTHRMLIGRSLEKHLAQEREAPFPSLEERIAAAEFARAGNCGEFAYVAIHQIADRTVAGEDLHLVSATGLDHQFTEMRTAAGREHDVVIDAWSSGPAILAPDGRFTRGRTPPKTLIHLEGSDISTLPPQVRDARERLEPQGDALVERELRRHRAQGTVVPATHRFDETKVVSDRFAKRVAKKMATPVDPSAAVPKSRLRKLAERMTRPPKPEDPKLELRQQIHATAAARALGYGVKAATADAPFVASTARRLAD